MKRTLLLTAFAGMLYLGLTSASSGPGNQSLNGTGSPGANTTCGNCHGGGAGTTTATVELRKLSTGTSGPIVTQYQADTVYLVKVVGNNANLSHFGFQLTALNSANANAGTFTNVTGSMHIASVGNKNIVEHTAQLAKTNNQYEASFRWTAPATGAGTVTFYGVINGVDNTGQVNNDKPSAPFSVALTESTTSVKELNTAVEPTAYPNPCIAQLNLKLENGNYSLRSYDLAGKQVLSENITVSANAHTINTSNWPAGLYHIVLTSGSAQTTLMVMKDK